MRYIFIDVDGVLNALGSNPGPDYFPAKGKLSKSEYNRIFYPLQLNKQHAKWLLELSARTNANLAWATTWQDDADAEIGAKIGLPKLPVVHFEPYTREQSVSEVKSRGVIDHCKQWGVTGSVWFDDEPGIDYWLGPKGRKIVKHIKIHPNNGLQPEHIEIARQHFATMVEY
jgi:hypothetical protein